MSRSAGTRNRSFWQRMRDRTIYLSLLREYSQLYGLALLGHCLMSNHVHLIAVPHTSEALSQSLKQAHGCYFRIFPCPRIIPKGPVMQ